MLHTLDMFSEPLPAFNIEGHREVRTHCGGCVSLIIMYVLFLFAVLKLQHLLSKHNPSVNTFVERDVFDEEDIWYGAENEEFAMAFSVTHFIDGDVKNDPKFVKWYAEYVIQKDGELSFKQVPMHQCT